MPNLSIAGIIPAVITAYDDYGRVSPERLASIYDFQINGGVNGLFVGGSTGEWPLLTAQERKLVAQTALDTSNGRVPVIMHISSLLPHEVIDYAAWAQVAGVAAVSLLMPSYYTYDAEGMMRYFNAILPQVHLPVFLYNIPGNVKNALTPSLMKQLIEKYDIIAGVKDSSMDFLKLQEFAAAAPDRLFLTGNDAQVLPCLMWGGVGAISAAAGAFPEAVCRLYHHWQAGELEAAKALQNKLMAYRAFVVSHPALAVVKEALEYRGFVTGGLRAPLHELSRAQKDHLHALIDELALIPERSNV